MNDKFTLATFLRKYNNDEACLSEIVRIKYPKGIYCSNERKVTKFYKVNKRPVYKCSCGFEVSPLAGTIFEKTTTPLQYWFYAIFLMANTRSGVSAKQLERELGVTYKTAWRMFKQIRILMADTDKKPLNGVVEVDETYIGGKAKNRARKWVQGVEEEQKEAVLGMIQRGGKVYLKHVPNTGKWTLINQIKAHVEPNTTIYSDQWPAYTNLNKFGYNHDWVNHQEAYVKGDVSTQNMENFWSHLKRGVTGVYRHVSKKYLQAYADEFAFRYSNRQRSEEMFDLLLGQVGETINVS